MSILPTFFDRGGLSNHDKTTCFDNVDANKYLLQQRYEVHVHMLCSWSWCMLDAMRLEWCSFILYDWLSCASTRKKKGNNGDPNLETRSVRFVKHWPSNQQWATSLIKLNLCRCLCPYIRVYRCRHECTYMRTCVCMYIYIYIYIVACECWLMLFACFATRVHEHQFVTCATLKTICDGNQLEAADRSLRLAYHLLRVHMWNNM